MYASEGNDQNVYEAFTLPRKKNKVVGAQTQMHLLHNFQHQQQQKQLINNVHRKTDNTVYEYFHKKTAGFPKNNLGDDKDTRVAATTSIDASRRPTYGAYANLTLPRGPYLQYKFNSIQNNVGARSAISINGRPDCDASINNYFYDNNRISDSRISMLKREFKGLPRAKLREDDARYQQGLGNGQKYQLTMATDYASLRKLVHPTSSAKTSTSVSLSLSDKPPIVPAHCNYVTLADVSKVKVSGLNQLEGWALLCQSVQALQDMFLADTPSPSKVRPVVSPATFQITSRGRVAFAIVPATVPISSTDKFDLAFRCATNGSNVATVSSMINYLSPEYVSMHTGKKVLVSESEIEKMWIYSLGITLRQTIRRSPATIATFDSIPFFRNNYDINGTLSSLDKVILAMCEPRLLQRASLMFLLDIISEYCKNHQTKPFSHIVMDLFNQVASRAIQPERTVLKRSVSSHSESHRSDTDSGRSSDVDNRKLAISGPPSDLKVRHEKPPVHFNSLPRNHETLGKTDKIVETPTKDPARKHPLVRKINEARKRENRRNTIDIPSSDLKLAHAALKPELSKSTTHLNAVGSPQDLKSGLSLPDLTSPQKIQVLPTLKVRRHASVREDVLRILPPTETDLMTKGPEFILNATSSPKHLDLSEPKGLHARNIMVLLLTGKRVQIKCNPTAVTARQVFEAVVKEEKLVENFFLGLCALVGGDFVFLPMDLKIYKVAPQVWISNSNKKSVLCENVTLTLFLRVKYLLPTIRGISCKDSRHLLYLQLRKSVLEQQIFCTEDDLITLGGLALQAEVGDFMDPMRRQDYFRITHYIPESWSLKQEMAKYLRSSHFCKKGMTQADAEDNFVRYLQELKEYGMHLYSATWITEDNLNLDIYVAISLSGVMLFERSHKSVVPRKQNESQSSKSAFQRHLYLKLDWLEIENICYTRHVFCLIVRKTEDSKTKRIKYKFKMDSKKSFFAFSLASDHHKFYMKLKNSFVSIKSIAEEFNFPIEEKSSKIDVNAVVDKPVKSGKNRVRNLKKSMLNDNRLVKLKQRFLRRTKSSASSFSRTEREEEEKNKEENQNKENECPKLSLSDVESPSRQVNRNKVKMGTRVFSSQFLNKSFDNIHDTSCSSLDFGKHLGLTEAKLAIEDDEDDDKSSSGDSDFAKNHETFRRADSSACVIQTSLKSLAPSNFTNNETVSESLLEKFQNVSGANLDRLLKKVVVFKELNVHKKPFYGTNENFVSAMGRYLSHLTGDPRDYTLGISIVQGSDGNVYVKDIVSGGPGDKSGISIGDQILAVDGTSLINVAYENCIKILQNTSHKCELIISQIVYPKLKSSKSIGNLQENGKGPKLLNEYISRIEMENNVPQVASPYKSPMEKYNFQQFDEVSNLNEDKPVQLKRIDNFPDSLRLSSLNLSPTKSLPDIANSCKLAVATKIAMPRTFGLSRKYIGPVRYPVTPNKDSVKTTIAPSKQNSLSLFSETTNDQVFI